MAEQTSSSNKFIRVQVKGIEADIENLEVEVCDTQKQPMLGGTKGTTDKSGCCDLPCDDTTFNKLAAGNESVVIRLRAERAEAFEATTKVEKKSDDILLAEMTFVCVPNVCGYPRQKAEKSLNQHGLQMQATDEPLNAIAPDKVFQQDPEPGYYTTVPQSTVTVRIAVPALVAVPDVTGDSESDAIQNLEEEGLKPSVKNKPSRRQAGRVFRQSPAAGTQVSPGTEVEVHIAEALANQIHGELCWVQTRNRSEVQLEGVFVELHDDSTQHRFATTCTDQQGRFLFDQVPTGDWTVVLPATIDPNDLPAEWLQSCGDKLPSTLPELRLDNDALAQISVPLANGEVFDAGRIDYVAAQSVVRGTVVWRQGADATREHPLAGLTVTLANLTTGKQSTTKTDGQGIFTFHPSESGTYVLEAKRSISATESQKLGLGQEQLQLDKEHSSTRSFAAGPGREVDNLEIIYTAVSGDVHGVIFLDQDQNQQRLGSEPGIPGIPVLLVDQQGGAVASTYTTQSGEYFLAAPPGHYTLRFAANYTLSAEYTTTPNSVARPVVSSFIARHGAEFELTSEMEQRVEIMAGLSTEAEPTGYQREVHEIRGKIAYQMQQGAAEEQGIPDVLVRLYNENGQELDAVLTDKDGNYVFANRQGTFYVRFPESPASGELISPETREIVVNSVAWLPTVYYRRRPTDTNGSGSGGVAPSDSALSDAVLDIAAYMPTQETGGPATKGNGYGAHRTSDSGALQEILDGALVNVLGRRFDKNDSRAFYDSLTRSFAVETVDGKRQIKLTQRAYAVQTELGGTVTGAAASLYHRGQAALNDALLLLTGLDPLDPDSDKQEFAAIRSIIKTEFVELVNEFGLEEGPRQQRVNDTFSLLFEQLDLLEAEGGYSDQFINTVDEEQHLTNFLVVRDYVSALDATWRTFQQEFDQTKFLGTQLVLLERAFFSVGESVNETYQLMNSVYLGPAERQAVRIIFPRTVTHNGQSIPILDDNSIPEPLLVEELLSWVSRFAQTEGPTLIRDGGRRGVETIKKKASLLQRLVLGAAQTQSVSHIGYSRVRVRRSLSELATQLEQVATLSGEIRRKA